MHRSQASTLGALFGEETMKAKLQEVIYWSIRRRLGKMYNILVLGLWGLGLFSALSAFSQTTVTSGPLTQARVRSEEHTSELQSRLHLVCRLLLEKKKKKRTAVRDRS